MNSGSMKIKSFVLQLKWRCFQTRSSIKTTEGPLSRLLSSQCCPSLHLGSARYRQYVLISLTTMISQRPWSRESVSGWSCCWLHSAFTLHSFHLSASALSFAILSVTLNHTSTHRNWHNRMYEVPEPLGLSVHRPMSSSACEQENPSDSHSQLKQAFHLHAISKSHSKYQSRNEIVSVMLKLMRALVISVKRWL